MKSFTSRIKLLGFLFIVFCSYAQVSAQETEQAHLHLKDGSVLKGEVVGATNEHITIVLLTGDTVNIKFDLIGTSADGLARDKKPRVVYTETKRGPSKKEIRESNKLRSIERRNNRPYILDFNLGIIGHNESSTELSLLAAYKVSDKFSAGIIGHFAPYRFGVGGQQFGFGSLDEPEFAAIMPALRYTFVKNEKARQFYAEIAGGIALPTNNERFAMDFIQERSNGLIARPSVGMRFITQKSLIFSISMSCRYLSHTGFLSEPDFRNPGQVITQEYSKKYILPMLCIGIGL